MSFRFHINFPGRMFTLRERPAVLQYHWQNHTAQVLLFTFFLKTICDCCFTVAFCDKRGVYSIYLFLPAEFNLQETCKLFRSVHFYVQDFHTPKFNYFNINPSNNLWVRVDQKYSLLWDYTRFKSWVHMVTFLSE